MSGPIKQKLVTCKELAAMISRGRGWVCAAKSAGAPCVGRLYEVEEFIAWMRANPDFTRGEVYRGRGKKPKRGHRRAKPRAAVYL
jgi:hypothetical protein